MFWTLKNADFADTKEKICVCLRSFASSKGKKLSCTLGVLIFEQARAIAYVAEAEIVHVHNETPHGVYNRYRREAMALRKIYPEAYFDLYDFLRLTITNTLSDLWHAARERVLLKNFVSIFWFRFMQFHGTRMGHRDTSLVTPQLRETFYYARERKKKEDEKRDMEPIRYNSGNGE